MFVARAVAVVAMAGFGLAAPEFALAQEKPGRQAEPRPQGAPPQNVPPRNQQDPFRGIQIRNQAKGDEIFLKLQKMTPEERDKALQQLPPARRQQIEKRIQNFENLPPDVREQRLKRLEKLNALPLGEQAKVRQSMKDLQELPNDRKRAVNQELQRMSVMGDEERQYHMNTEEFVNRFSPAEQEMLGNLSKVY